MDGLGLGGREVRERCCGFVASDRMEMVDGCGRVKGRGGVKDMCVPSR